MQFAWNPKTAEVGHQDICHHLSLLVRDGIYLWPLGEVVHISKEVSNSSLAFWKGSSEVDSKFVEQCPDVILLH
jgi:hypothetical protein